MKKTQVPPNFEDDRQSFENFERLAKALMTVPKEELDKEIAKEDRKKTKTNSKNARNSSGTIS